MHIIKVTLHICNTSFHNAKYHLRLELRGATILVNVVEATAVRLFPQLQKLSNDSVIEKCVLYYSE